MSIILKILSVPVIMACATGGTIGLMKLIKKVPGATDESGEFRESYVERKIRENQERRARQSKEEQ